MVYKALHGLTEVSSCSSSPCNVHWFFPPFTLGCSLNMPGVFRPCQPSFAFPSALLYFLPKMSTQLAPSFSSDLYIKVVLQWGSAFILSKMSTPSSPPSRSMPLPSFFSWAPIPVQQLTIVPNYPCTLNHLRVGYWHSLVYHMNKNIFLYNHTMTVKIQEMNADTLYYVILRPHSGFASCPNDVFYSRMILFRIMCCV